MSACIVLENVSKIYATPAGEQAALAAVSLEVFPGEHVALIGKSGSGKSTLLNLIGGIDHPTTGRARLFGTYLDDLDESRLARFRGAHVGIVFQFFQLIPTLSALENVVLAMDLVGRIERRGRKARAMALLERMEVAGHAGKLPAQLSGGEQQRVAIARALANDPPVLIADEPTGNLDSQNGERVRAIFHSCAEEGRTVIVATHDRDGLDRYSRQLSITDGVLADLPAEDMACSTPV